MRGDLEKNYITDNIKLIYQFFKTLWNFMHKMGRMCPLTQLTFILIE